MPSFVDAGILVLAGALAGSAGHYWWARQARKTRRQIPRHWPLDQRRIVNSQEQKLWRWLVKTFPQHHIMIKLPITRFTIPQAGENSDNLYELLNKVYCTFTVCAPTGEVVGCVDVRGKKPLPRSNQLLKLGLLSQCEICYSIIEPDDLPDPVRLRIYFLGEDAQQEQRVAETDFAKRLLASAQVQLRAAVERQRDTRKSEPDGGVRTRGVAFELLGPGEYFDSKFVPAAPQADSFIMPLDSRRAALK